MFSAECELISKGCEHGDVFRGTGGRRLWIFHRMQADIHGFRKTRLFITGRGRILHPSFPARGHRASCALLFFAIFRQIISISDNIELFSVNQLTRTGVRFIVRAGDPDGVRGRERFPAIPIFRHSSASASQRFGVPAFRHSSVSPFLCFGIPAFPCSGMP